ncbi:longitudinals lacking protein-like [Anopheles nili]|uniref:longitudinals lacking protein-like n=1 Tax=Anopheles nili TaxID=185578 RepID=UPI00237B49F2|nr:longitudinals lacking protein-like [Anopheles nili]
MDDDQQFCLRWNNHQSTLISVFDTLLENGTLVDCTLAAEGKFLKAHKVVLSACSPYFATLLSQQYDKHPIFILKDVKFQELRAMMDYMYRGEVNISQDQLAALLKAAESLQIKGLSDNRSNSSSSAAAAAAAAGGGVHQQQQQKLSDASATKSLQPPVPASKASGLTIENKRPLKSELLESDVSGSREGSTSPTARKRKKVRRRSVDTNNLLIDNHDQHSNSSSHSIHTATGANTSAAVVGGASGVTANAAASALSSSSTAAAGVNSSANVLSVAAVAAAAALKKTETVQQAAAETLKLQKQQAAAVAAAAAAAQSSDDDERCGPGSVATGTEHDDGNELTDNEHDGDGASSVKSGSRHHHLRDGGRRGKTSTSSVGELMIEPKSEYEDVQDENVEDLTMDDEDLMDELDQPGPSHGGDVSSQGYAQWPMEREQNEAFIAAQDAVGGQHRDAQGRRKLVILSKRVAEASSSSGDPGSLMALAGASPLTGGKKIKTITVTTSEPALWVDENEIPIITTNQGIRLRQTERQQQSAMIAGNVECDFNGSSSVTATTTAIATPLTEQSNDVGSGSLITHATPVVLNDCLLESKNIVVTKKDNNYILFTADPDASPEPPVSAGTTVMLPMRSATLVATGGASTSIGNTTTIATIIDEMRIEDLLKKEKIIKQTELHPDGTTATTYIFDECDILPIKTGTSTVAKGNVALSSGTASTGMVGKRVTSGNVLTPPTAVSGASPISSSAGSLITSVSIQKPDNFPNELVVPSLPKNDGSSRKLTHATISAPAKTFGHPRIKYSRAKNPYNITGNTAMTSSTITMPILTIPTVTPSIGSSITTSSMQLQEVSQQLAPQPSATVAGTERQLLNFSLSRKLGPAGQQPLQHVTITGTSVGAPGLTAINASAIQQIPIATAIGGTRGTSITTRYSVNEYETSGSNTSQSADFPQGMIDDLDYSVIEDIDLSDGVATNFSNVVAAAAAAAGTTLAGSGQQQQQQQQQQQTTVALVAASKVSSDVDNNGSQSDDDDGDQDMDEGGDDGSGEPDDDEQHIAKYNTKLLSKMKKEGVGGQTGGSKLLNASMGDSKFALLANPNIMQKFEYTVNESTVVSDTDDGEVRQYVCRHCGKRYRWKSTLRRHENVECGGKEASHQCPYCSYKAKQRGNLGVHIRKHHAEMPQLESRRRSNKSRHSI